VRPGLTSAPLLSQPILKAESRPEGRLFVPTVRRRALVAVCACAAATAASAWVAAPASQPVPDPLEVSASSVLGVTHDGGDTAVRLRAPDDRADRALARAPLASMPATDAVLSPVATQPHQETLADAAAGLAARQAAAKAAAKAAASAKIAAAKAKAAAEKLAYEHRWVRPNYGGLSSPFAMRWGRMHEGIDLAGGYGSQIVAAVEGTVLYAGPESGYGRVVKILDWDGTQTWYGHMSKFLVKAGDHVAAGQPIALVGAAGDATGPHLHFEVRVGGVPVDPIPFLAARGVRI
jgi:murein DD-endopeptidase MepM/ murein hydrolase activator NlpD